MPTVPIPAYVKRQSVIRSIALLDIAVMLFPPLHWRVASGDTALSLGFFLGAGLFVVVSLPLMYTLDRRAVEEQ